VARVLIHIGIIAVLTVLTQLGGLAWLLALVFQRRLLAFGLLYASFSLAAVFTASQTGRVPLPCFSGETLKVQSWAYCLMNRHYVTPEMRAVLQDTGQAIASQHPGTVTLVLDAGFPFLDGFPLFPHLSHSDGRKADIALYYQQDGVYLPGKTRSPIGYFAFEDGPSPCPPTFPTLRWNFAFLQPLWPNYALDDKRTWSALVLFARDPRVGKVFIEPHLKDRLGVAHPKVRFQGCRAARHDDHIHIELRADQS